jgi:membrane-bound lytic murein transglycosylase B
VTRSFPHAWAPAAALALALAACPTPGWCAGFDVSRPEIRSFIDEVSHRDRVSAWRVRRLLRKAHSDPSVIERISRPIEQVLPWWQYRTHFVTSTRIEGGVRLWQQQRSTLEHISEERGVPPQYILAILGCETFYGRITGNDRVLDTLATLAFD